MRKACLVQRRVQHDRQRRNESVLTDEIAIRPTRAARGSAAAGWFQRGPGLRWPSAESSERSWLGRFSALPFWRQRCRLGVRPQREPVKRSILARGRRQLDNATSEVSRPWSPALLAVRDSLPSVDRQECVRSRMGRWVARSALLISAVLARGLLANLAIGEKRRNPVAQRARLGKSYRRETPATLDQELGAGCSGANWARTVAIHSSVGRP